MKYEMIIFLIYIGIISFMSLITFFTYLIDKKKAVNNKERTKEKTLLSMTAFGGAIGALFGSLIFRHKTNKSYFVITIFLSLVIQVGLLVFISLVAFKGVLEWNQI